MCALATHVIAGTDLNQGAKAYASRGIGKTGNG
jgi:hypothetical protein